MSPGGGCSCGQARYRLLSAPLFVNCCHCRLCQRMAGSAFVINAPIEADRVYPSGSIEAADFPSGSGIPQRVHRCATCRTALWSVFRDRAGLRFVRVGTLDQPEAHPPAAHVFTTTKLPWIGLPPGIPAFPRYYDPATVWPAESLLRLRAIA